MKPGIDRTRIDPQYLLELIEPVAQVYRAMEHDLIVKLARRFDPKKLKRGVVQDLREQGQGGGVYESFMLSQVGALRDDCIQTIAEYAGDISQASTATIEQSVTDAIGVIEPEFTGTTPVPVSDTVRRVTGLYESQAINRQNLVNTVMLNSTLAHYRESIRDVTKLMRQLQTTQEALNTDTGRLIQGETTLRQAIASTLGKVAESGLAGFVDRAGREWDAEAYVRMDMKTTTANTAREAVFERNADYGNNLIMVSSHPGARPGCEPWQGRIYSTDGSSGTVEDLHGKTYEYIPLGDTSYGEPAGLFGINCGHYPSPFFAGQSVMRWPQYDHEETVRLYRESQEQRYMERKIRKEKTKADALEAAGDLQGAKAARKRAREKNAELKAWCDEKGRAYYPERTRVVKPEKTLTIGSTRDKINSETGNHSFQMNLQLFAAPRDPSKYATVYLDQKEYAHVMSELNTHMSESDREKRVVIKAIGDYIYTVENKGFNEYRIIGREEIDPEIEVPQ